MTDGFLWFLKYIIRFLTDMEKKYSGFFISDDGKGHFHTGRQGNGFDVNCERAFLSNST